MPTAQISSPACLRATTTSAPSIPLAVSWNKFQSLSRKGETESRRTLVDFFTAHPRASDINYKNVRIPMSQLGGSRAPPLDVNFGSEAASISSIARGATDPPSSHLQAFPP